MSHVLLGIGMLLGGIFVMRYGLKKALWHQLQTALARLTNTPWRGLVLGAVAAALLQSSTTVCLITIGLVGADYMTFRQALGIVLGANIGTCSTVQLVNMAVPLEYLLPLLLLSALLCVFRKLRYVSLACTGLFGMLAGVDLLVTGISAMTQLQAMGQYLVLAREQPLYGIWGGVLATTVFQSSSAATALLMLMTDRGLVDITTAAYMVYGNNIGSCISSIVFSAAAPTAARQVALSHILLNVAGAAVFFPATGLLIAAAGWCAADFSSQVAAIHTIFNVLSSLLVLPFFNRFAGLILLLIPEPKARIK